MCCDSEIMSKIDKLKVYDLVLAVYASWVRNESVTSAICCRDPFSITISRIDLELRFAMFGYLENACFLTRVHLYHWKKWFNSTNLFSWVLNSHFTLWKFFKRHYIELWAVYKIINSFLPWYTYIFQYFG